MLTPLHKEMVKAEIRGNGITLTALAKKNGLSPDAIALSFLRPIPKAHRAVANFLKKPVHILFPCWYDASGAPTYKVRKKRTPKTDSRHGKKRGTK